MLKTVICRDCGNSFVGNHNAYYCPKCFTNRRRIAYRESWRKKQLKKKSIPQPPKSLLLSELDADIAKSLRKMPGSFSVWKLVNPEDYEMQLRMRGVKIVGNEVRPFK